MKKSFLFFPLLLLFPKEGFSLGEFLGKELPSFSLIPTFLKKGFFYIEGSFSPVAEKELTFENLPVGESSLVEEGKFPYRVRWGVQKREIFSSFHVGLGGEWEGSSYQGENRDIGVEEKEQNFSFFSVLSFTLSSYQEIGLKGGYKEERKARSFFFFPYSYENKEEERRGYGNFLLSSSFFSGGGSISFAMDIRFLKEEKFFFQEELFLLFTQSLASLGKIGGGIGVSLPYTLRLKREGKVQEEKASFSYKVVFEYFYPVAKVFSIGVAGGYNPFSWENRKYEEGVDFTTDIIQGYGVTGGIIGVFSFSSWRIWLEGSILYAPFQVKSQSFSFSTSSTSSMGISSNILSVEVFIGGGYVF